MPSWLLAAANNQLHSALPYFLKNSVHKGVLLNQTWGHYPGLVVHGKGHDYSTAGIFTFDMRPYNNGEEPTTFRKYQELTMGSHFYKKAKVSLDEDPGIVTLAKRQKNPDIYVHTEHVNVKYQISMDLKNLINYGCGANYIVRLSHEDYAKLLNNFYHFYKTHGGQNLSSVKRILYDLGQINDVENEHAFWLQNAHHFHPYHPPLRISNNFDLSNLSDTGILFYKQGEILIIKLDDYLKSTNCPELLNGTAVSPGFEEYLQAHYANILEIINGTY